MFVTKSEDSVRTLLVLVPAAAAVGPAVQTAKPAPLGALAAG